MDSCNTYYELTIQAVLTNEYIYERPGSTVGIAPAF